MSYYSESSDELFEYLDSIHNEEQKSSKSDSDNKIRINYQDKTKNFNEKIIYSGLLPELKANETQKRDLKPILMKKIIALIFVHSIVMLLLLVLLVCATTINCTVFKNIDIDTFKELSGFMQFFVVASLSEFISMLVVIVHYIFDKSIVKLMESYKPNSQPQKGNGIQSSNGENLLAELYGTNQDETTQSDFDDDDDNYNNTTA